MADVADAEFRQEGSSLPKGSATQLRQGLAFASESPADTDTPDPVAGSLGGIESFVPEGPSDPLDAELFAPTDRPNVPLSGYPVRAAPRISDRALLTRVASRVLENRDAMPEMALMWAVRTLAGE